MKLRKILCSLGMTVVFAVGGGMTAEAADIVEVPSTEIDSVYDQEVQSNALEGWAEGPQIYSESGIVMDMDSGAILYAKNIHDQHYPASITKVMTALTALQNYEMDEMVDFTWDNIGFLEYGDAHIGIKPDEQVKMEDCMYGMLLASANEVSHAIGTHMEGGYEEFLRVMNETAKEIGCQNSNWMNTHGLHDPEHYTTVYDMALIGSEVFQYEKFREITKTKQYTIGETNITDEIRTFQQNHDMLFEYSDRYYEYCVGGKTGYTDQALTTLVTFASKDDMNLVAVVMRTHGGGQNAYVDTREMLDYAFENFRKVYASAGLEIPEQVSRLETGAYVVLPQEIKAEQMEYKFEEPVDVDDKTGVITYTYGGQIVGKMEATITEEAYNEIHGVEAQKDSQSEESKENPWMVVKVVLGILAVLILLMAALLGFVAYKRRQIRKRRRLRRMKRRREWEKLYRE